MNIEMPTETKSEVSVTFQKDSDTDISGFEYAETGGTCTITVTGRVYMSEDEEEYASIRMNPDTVKISKAGEEELSKSLKGDMNRMMHKRKWRPGND